MNKTIVIKVGGSILEDANNIASLCENLKILLALDVKVILIHGGSKAINQELRIHEIESSFLQGLRVTSPEAMHVIEMVLSGYVNKKLVKKLNASGVSAVGLSGVDNNMLLSRRYHDEYGCVGEVVDVNQSFIKKMLEISLPVISPISVDRYGNTLNINADCAASMIASVMKVDHLIYLTDQEGIYDNKGYVIPKLSLEDLQDLISEETVKDGMLAKAKTIQMALQSGINNIHVLSGKKTHCFLDLLTGKRCEGTFCFSQHCTV